MAASAARARRVNAYDMAREKCIIIVSMLAAQRRGYRKRSGINQAKIKGMAARGGIGKVSGVAYGNVMSVDIRNRNKQSLIVVARQPTSSRGIIIRGVCRCRQSNSYVASSSIGVA